MTFPAAIKPRSSRAETEKMRRRPSIFSSVASAATRWPTAVGEMCSTWTRTPTEVIPSSRRSVSAITVASSNMPMSRGVASVGTLPERNAIAVSASETSIATLPVIPAFRRIGQTIRPTRVPLHTISLRAGQVAVAAYPAAIRTCGPNEERR